MSDRKPIMLIDNKIDIVLRRLDAITLTLNILKDEVASMKEHLETTDIKLQEVINKQNESWFWSGK